jgi:NAD(P)-dependent dehydrogenase (short-subunit alcohol dehydrogenase family)
MLVDIATRAIEKGSPVREWNDSIAFISGGGQGIGLGIARALGKRGVRLALADIDDAALAASRRELSRLTDVEVFPLDVRDRDGYAAAAGQTEARLGPVDLLFNNAGIAPYSSVSRLDYRKWDSTLGINLCGVVNGIQTFLPRMIERGRGGHVVNTASGAGLIAGPNVLYTTSKYAVVGLSESLRLAAVRHGIDVSVLCPGYVNTDILEHTQAMDEGSSSLLLPEHSRAEAEPALRSGVDIDAVGEMVLAGIEARAMWIYTDDAMRPYLTMRMEKLLEALPVPAVD